MPAYILAELDVFDSVRFEEYKKLAAAAVERYGGRYVARGGRVEELEGSWSPKRLVILEFSTTEQARAWWHSTEYEAAKAVRRECARSKFILVEGV